MTKETNIAGEVFGRWSVIARGGNTNAGKAKWLCVCECGTEREVCGASLLRGVSVSCGCHQKEVVTKMNIKHGMVGTTEYGSWQNMMNRCYNKSGQNWELYGGRGIKVCDRWHDFSNFYEDMGQKPDGKNSIDRIDVNGDYEPSNCRWADQTEQMNNMRRNRIETYKGESMTVSQLARKYGIKPSVLSGRLNRYNKTIEEALA